MGVITSIINGQLHISRNTGHRTFIQALQLIREVNWLSNDSVARRCLTILTFVVQCQQICSSSVSKYITPRLRTDDIINKAVFPRHSLWGSNLDRIGLQSPIRNGATMPQRSRFIRRGWDFYNCLPVQKFLNLYIADICNCSGIIKSLFILQKTINHRLWKEKYLIIIQES